MISFPFSPVSLSSLVFQSFLVCIHIFDYTLNKGVYSGILFVSPKTAGRSIQLLMLRFLFWLTLREPLPAHPVSASFLKFLMTIKTCPLCIKDFQRVEIITSSHGSQDHISQFIVVNLAVCYSVSEIRASVIILCCVWVYNVDRFTHGCPQNLTHRLCSGFLPPGQFRSGTFCLWEDQTTVLMQLEESHWILNSHKHHKHN